MTRWPHTPADPEPQPFRDLVLSFTAVAGFVCLVVSVIAGGWL